MFLSLADARKRMAEHGIPVSYAAIWRLVSSGKIPATRVGRKWYVTEAAIEQLLTT
jgi:excisionase family DNA binding protein